MHFRASHERQPARLTAAIDHLVYGVPELSAGVQLLAERLGVTAAAGGSHEARGSHNALLSLGAGAYLEIIAPDPGQPPPSRPRPFGLDSLAEPRLVTYAVHAAQPHAVPNAVGQSAALPPPAAWLRLDQWRAQAAARNYDPGPVAAMSRRRPDGTLLSWHLCQRPVLPFGGVVPFLIDWGDAKSPAGTTPIGCRLLALEVSTPDQQAVDAAIGALGVALRVREGDQPTLHATLATPHGIVELT